MPVENCYPFSTGIYYIICFVIRIWPISITELYILIVFDLKRSHFICGSLILKRILSLLFSNTRDICNYLSIATNLLIKNQISCCVYWLTGLILSYFYLLQYLMTSTIEHTYLSSKADRETDWCSHKNTILKPTSVDLYHIMA